MQAPEVDQMKPSIKCSKTKSELPSRRSELERALGFSKDQSQTRPGGFFTLLIPFLIMKQANSAKERGKQALPRTKAVVSSSEDDIQVVSLHN